MQLIENIDTRLRVLNNTLQADLQVDTRHEAEILLAHALQKQRSFLRAYPETRLTQQQLSTLDALVDRRLQGEPIAYITGHREFWTLDLVTNEHTLIPRPETELLIELALEKIPANRKFLVAELGTGTGAIALAIASERPLCTVLATDISPQALDVARKNALKHQAKNVQFFCGNWFDALPQTGFDLIVSNPPYIAENDKHLQQGDVRFEPALALCSGKDGLDAIRHIASAAHEHLVDGAHLLMEHGYDQREEIFSILKQAAYGQVTLHDDLNGVARVSIARKGKDIQS